MIDEVKHFQPDIIIAPYLTRFIPAAIYDSIPTFIVHPGILGDKGPHALDHALLEKKSDWGVCIIKANGEFDGGDIYVQEHFSMRFVKKSALYRKEVNSAASKAVRTLLKQFQQDTLRAEKQLSTPMHAVLQQSDRAIDWLKDSTQEIIRKVHAADSHPGLLDILLGEEVYLFGVHKEHFLQKGRLYENYLKASLKEIFAKRDGAICLKTSDGAVWISHLKKEGYFKLPATYTLKERLRGVREERIPLISEGKASGFHEISLKIIGEVAYLYFDFLNGAFSAEQSIRLKYAIESMKERCKVLVLMGGKEFFSNGIHLNILEDSKKPGEDGWSNINAMNDMVRALLLSDEFLTVAAIRGGAGAGGLFFGLACDYVLVREGVVLNPHYKTLGLSGSEFHTYTLPKRIGREQAEKILDEALPLVTKEAVAIGMIDKVLPEYSEHFEKELHHFCHALCEDEDSWYEQLDAKRDRLEEDATLIEQLHQQELNRMHPEFWDSQSSFHQLRHDFVYKQCPTQTPQRLKQKERHA